MKINFVYLKCLCSILGIILINSCGKEEITNQVQEKGTYKSLKKAPSNSYLYNESNMIHPDPGNGQYPAPAKNFNFDNTRWYRNSEGKIVVYAYAQASTRVWPQNGDNCDAKVQVMLMHDNQIYNNYREETIVYGEWGAEATISKTWIFEPTTDLSGITIVAQGNVWGCFKPYLINNKTTIHDIYWTETIRIPLPNIIPIEGTLKKPNIIISEQNGTPNINWQAIEGANQYQIWRKRDNGSYELIKTSSSCYFVDNEVATKPIKESWFYYKVVAKNDYCSSLNSNVVSIQGQIPS
jgi:alpha-L-fucosidase